MVDDELFNLQGLGFMLEQAGRDIGLRTDFVKETTISTTNSREVMGLI
jgi:hypothetical protein